MQDDFCPVIFASKLIEIYMVYKYDQLYIYIYIYIYIYCCRSGIEIFDNFIVLIISSLGSKCESFYGFT
jgi:hypothetical protein